MVHAKMHLHQLPCIHGHANKTLATYPYGLCRTFSEQVINTQRACTRVMVIVSCVCVSVRIFCNYYSATLHIRAAKLQHRQLHCNNILILKLAIYQKLLRWRVMACKASKQAFMQMSTSTSTCVCIFSKDQK